jgi:hypothetical protein
MSEEQNLSNNQPQKVDFISSLNKNKNPGKANQVTISNYKGSGKF